MAFLGRCVKHFESISRKGKLKVLSFQQKKNGAPSSTVLFNSLNIFDYYSSQKRFYTSHKLPVNTVALFVPQQEAWVVERMGKFHTVLEPVSNHVHLIIYTYDMHHS